MVWLAYLLFSLFYSSQRSLIRRSLYLTCGGERRPKFVEGFLGLSSGSASEINLGFLPVFRPLAALLYIFGGLLFGIATLRAGILPRWSAGVLAFGSLAPLAASLLGHPLDRILAVPMGLALIFIGYALRFEKREKV